MLPVVDLKSSKNNPDDDYEISQSQTFRNVPEFVTGRKATLLSTFLEKSQNIMQQRNSASRAVSISPLLFVCSDLLDREYFKRYEEQLDEESKNRRQHIM